MRYPNHDVPGAVIKFTKPEAASTTADIEGAELAIGKRPHNSQIQRSRNSLRCESLQRRRSSRVSWKAEVSGA